MTDPHRVMRGALWENRPLAPLTTLRIGGPVRWFAVPEDEDDVRAILAWAAREELPWRPIGLGSNLLCPDAGYSGLIVSLDRARSDAVFEGTRLLVGAGAHLSRVVAQAARRGLTGLEALAGVPGSVGGALAMNAGTAQGQIASLVRSVRVLRPTGAIENWSADDLQFGYRTCRLQTEGVIALSAELQLAAADPAAIQRDLRARLDRRRRTQPLQWPNAGSIWRNPPGEYAARLIESAGCKGWREGDAEIAALHANFIVNRGCATAEQVMALMARTRRTVERRFGVRLDPEIRWLLGPEALEAYLDRFEKGVGDDGTLHGAGG